MWAYFNVKLHFSHFVVPEVNFIAFIRMSTDTKNGYVWTYVSSITLVYIISVQPYSTDPQQSCRVLPFP